METAQTLVTAQAAPLAEALSAAPSPLDEVLNTAHALLRFFLFLSYWFYTFSRWLIAFATLTLPRYAYNILSWNLSLRIDFTKAASIILVTSTILSYAYKVKFLNRYTQLKETPLVLDEGFDLHPDLAQDQASAGFHNYLDEFLSAIKVFGYLEKPVFHELARHLQTRRLVAGDTLNLDSDKSFYIVVDGSVQVFAQTASPTKPRDAYDDEDDNGYQLLNNVQSGGTLSSLFTILSLFTEDVKLRYEETDDAGPSEGNDRSRSTSQGSPPFPPQGARSANDRDPDVSEFNLNAHNQDERAQSSIPPPSGEGLRSRHGPRPRSSSSFASSSAETLTYDGASTSSATEAGSPRPRLSVLEPIFSVPGTPSSSFAPSSAGLNGGHSFDSRSRPPAPEKRPSEGTIARATVDTTLAVIPAEAFRRLTKKFPNAAAHIVQVILTRLQRVTFLTAHKYLGLTREVIRTEKAINELACYPLPEAFWESGGIQRLRQRFVPQTSAVEKGNGENDLDYFALDPPTPYSGPAMGQRVDTDTESYFEGVRLRARTSQRTSARNAGDLLSMSSMTDAPEHLSGSFVPTTPKPQQRTASFNIPATPTMGAEPDFDLREAVMQSISKAIGLVQPSVTPAASVDASPMVRPQDSNLQKAVFNSSFGSLSFLGLQGYDDESSVTGSSVGSFSSTELENEVEILYFPKDSMLVKAGEKNAGLYFVIDGFLDVSMPEDSLSSGVKKPATAAAPSRPPPNFPPPQSGGPRAGPPGGARVPQRPPARRAPDSSRPQTRFDLPPLSTPEAPKEKQSTPLFTVKPGGIAGYLSSLSGFPSYVDIQAKTECYVGFLPAKALERIMDRKPIVLLTLAKRLISLLSPLVLHIDSALEWMHVSAGQVIYRQGDESDSFYIVINGRLRSIHEKTGGGVQILGEYGQGESVGELDCITSSTRPSTLHAIRDTEIARMPMTLFNAISVRHPLVTIQISRIIASRVRQQMDSRSSIPASIGRAGANEMGKNNFNLKTVAILPINRHVPVSEFSTKLLHALETIGAPTSYLNQATVMTVLGRHAFSRMGTLKLAGWLAETEQKYRIVLYVADTAVSAPWTQTCIRQADCILLVADGGTEPELGEYEKLLVGMKTTARKELVLLHSERNVPNGSTRPWLKNRPWIHAHHHVEMGSATPHPHREHDETAPAVALRKIKKTVELQIGKYKKSAPRPQLQRPETMSDFARLARRLCGKSIGIVLGGGGARGISHIGVLRALAEEGVPIDMVGGTSIGAFVGGLYALEGDLVSTFGRAKRFSGRMSTLWRILTDLTYPVVAYTSGHEFNRGIYKSFYDAQIEDMWLPFFCNTTNITHSRMEIHTSGFAWRYIRASMSLAGLLPPLCDEQFSMLVDGGYMDNLPVSVMLSMGAASVFAVDVGSVDDTSPRKYGDSVSGWWLLLSRWNPFTETPNIPNITEIQSRLTYVSSVKTLEEAKATPGVLYMRMPVTQYGTMEFSRFTELLDVGFSTAKQMLGDWSKEGKLPTGTEGDLSPVIKKRGQSMRRNSI